MAFDGITIACLVDELQHTLTGARINKIAQPEADELLLTCKNTQGQVRLALSASASLPYVYLMSENKTSPLQAPTFCMVLRKHIAGGRITAITQPGLERIIRFEIEHLNEMGDPCRKFLIVELMGKHSNLIFCDENDRIIDSIKHVPASMSSLRQVLPGCDYFIASTQSEKKDPFAVLDSDDATKDTAAFLLAQPTTITKAIYSGFTGLSPVMASEIAHRAGLDGNAPIASLNEHQLLHLANHFVWMIQDVKECRFTPQMIRDGKEPVEFSALELTQYADLQQESYDSISCMLSDYYSEKAAYTRIHQKSAELRHIVSTALERNYKKYQLQQKQLSDTEKRDRYRIYGELIQAYGYGLPKGAKKLDAPNYYDENRMISIPLDAMKTPQENAKKYFERYNKLKRTYEALSTLVQQTKHEIEHLESIQNALDIAQNPEDLAQIREEMVEYGYIKKRGSVKKQQAKSRPLHYLSTDGYDIYVGKNNYQNDMITFKMATGNDWWFHAKGIPGSHVIVRTGNDELPDRVFEEAAALAGFYSKGRASDKLEIDYLQKKNVKKPNASAPGFVVYYTNYSMTVKPQAEGLTLLED